MPAQYLGLIGICIGLLFVITILGVWLWWYAFHGKSNSSDKSEKKPKKKLEIYPGHDDLI